MRAAVLNGPRDLAILDRPTPVADAGDVVIKVTAAGVCAGDLYLYEGRNPYATYPRVCGHEIAGEVAAVTGDAGSLRPGQAVVVEPFIGCGRCYPCSLGKSNCCARLTILGVNRDGGFAEFLTAPARNVHPIPAGMDTALAALAEPVAIGVQACRRGHITGDDLVLVLGCGPIGLAIVEVARAKGARVLAVDLVEEKLAAAASMGATTFMAGDDLAERVLAETGGEGAPVVVEATGNPRAMSDTLKLVASGGRIVIVGLVKAGVEVSFQGLDLTRKEPTILGSRASVDCFPEALELLASGRMVLPTLVRQLSMWDAAAILADMAEDPASLRKTILRT